MNSQQLEAYLRRIESKVDAIDRALKLLADESLAIKNDNVHLNRDVEDIKSVLKLGEWKEKASKQKKETGT